MSDSRRMRRAVGQLAVRVGGHAVWVSALMCCVLLAGISIGETFIPWRHVLSTLANHLFDTHYPVDALDAGIVWNYRLTRALVSASCGACLAVSGVVLQSLLRNALAEPYLLGISAGASTGAVLIALTGLGLASSVCL
jgi:iron complex transport system permease protein